MKAIVSLLLASLLVAAAPPLTGAPADKYFGRLGMSALRIRYEIAQLKRRYESGKELPEDLEHLASFTEDAYYKWAAAYPKDSWLASTGYNLAKLYEDFPGEDARSRALRVLTFVRGNFKNTRYAKQAASELQRGLSLKPYPQWAIKLRPTPTPSPSPRPSSPASGGPSIAPSASPKPAPSPTRS